MSMVQAVSGSSAATTLSAGAAAAGLSAQLARYQKQLSDCVNCASAKTPEGKANIEELSAKISAVKARMERVSGSGSLRPDQPATPQSDRKTAASGQQIDVYA